MKRIHRRLGLLLTIIFMCGLFSVTAGAKDLEPCYHCDKTGKYHCNFCNNTGIVTCDGCHGVGKPVCPGEDGKRPCDHGYYICPGCKGTGHPIGEDGNIDYSLPCLYGGEENNCNGTGKISCWNCHGKGFHICDRCNGEGKRACMASICPDARAIGYKCPYCKGAGYLLTNFWPGENDGVQNVPKNGDKIWVNGKSTTYGGGGDHSQTSTSDNLTDQSEPVPEQARWVVDFAGGNWNVKDKTVRAKIDGKTVEGSRELDAYTPIMLEGFDQASMRVRVCGENDFSVVLTPNGENEVSLGRYEPTDAVLPEYLRFVIEEAYAEHSNESESNPDWLDGEAPLPENRHTDFELPISPAREGVAQAFARVEMSRMSDEEQRLYAGMTDQELAQTLEEVRQIVSTAQPGRMVGDMEALLERMAAQNGFESIEKGRLFPIYFEGHQDIGFPIRITVTLHQGDLDGGKDLYVYHQRTDGTVEALGKAEFSTYDDGSVSSLSFYTTGFSWFFTSAKELDLSASEAEETILTVSGMITAAVAVTAAIAAGLTIFLVKKKKQK
ncbi:MAG: hypothetical protein J6X30_04050 [Clostridia bacterium]|nr:hypothetical protein [Clostridia bacterium]